ncbi:hypothetical protein FNF27_03674 [Cafeteria roenbergensis]|uniref:Uncharacterized protein n=1 Tax=Cafeteria roenbergensis TaxID=33653 RepID=A0A5A8EDJ8_CAFRO|nr:hypothetical protein FNF27_03674 [Cafeteria roenbergensis]
MAAPCAAATEAGPAAGGAVPPALCVLFLARFDPVNQSQLAVAADLALNSDASEVCLVPLGSDYDSAAGAGSLARHALLHAAVNTHLGPDTAVFAPPPHSWSSSSAETFEAVVRASRARMAPRDVAFTLLAPEFPAGGEAAAPASAAALLAATSWCQGRRISLCADGTIACDPEAGPGSGDEEQASPRRAAGKTLFPSLGPGCTLAPLDIVHETTARRIAALGSRLAGPSASDVEDRSGRRGCAAAMTPADGSAPESESGRRLSVGDALAGLVPAAVASSCQRYGLYGASPRTPAQRHWAPPSCPSSCRVSEGVVREAMAHGAGTAAASGRRRVAVLGGSFDPITRAHLMLAADGCIGRGVDEVWVVPCGPRPDKPGLRTHVAERLFDCVAAVEAALPASAPVFVVPLELHVPIALSTFELLCTAHRIHEGCTFELIAGADLAPSLPSWRHADQLMAAASFLWVPRPGYDGGGDGASLPSSDVAGRWLVPRNGMPRVAMRMSSTKVREAAAKAASQRGTLPGAVAALLSAMVVEPTAARIARGKLYRAE